MALNCVTSVDQKVYQVLHGLTPGACLVQMLLPCNLYGIIEYMHSADFLWPDLYPCRAQSSEEVSQWSDSH